MAPELLRPLDPAVWKACAGILVRIPPADSLVYYFPQGHAEQCSSPPPLAASKPPVLCRILAVDFLANPDTDEVFAKIRLQPTRRNLRPLPEGRTSAAGSDGMVAVAEEESNKVVSFSKVLTPSDANNGGGFSVPRFCADSIFPPLDLHADPPVQTLLITDIHGLVWEFRHIYRGTPRRHLLTTGWSKFVNQKKIVAGDSVVFMKNRFGRLFVGVRRAIRSTAAVDCGRWRMELQNVGQRMELEGGFSRNGKGRVMAEEVAEAVELAAQDMAFQVVYYPRAGVVDFVVRAEVVEASLSVYWAAGMRVKMAMETEDSSKMTWFQGTVSSLTEQGNGPWQRSPWRMLQVAWDEPEVLQHVKRVSPWHVEYVAPTPPLDSAFPPPKRFKDSQGPEMLTNGDRELLFPMSRLTTAMMGQFSPSLLSYNSFPAGMQGARQDSFCVSGLPNLLLENTPQMHTGNIFANTSPKLKFVSTDLNIGMSQSGNLSPDSNSTVDFSAMELVGNRGCNTSPKVHSSSIQLFGKIIHVEQPSESECNDGSVSEDDGSKSRHPLRDPYMNLLDTLGVQCERASAVEPCGL